MDQVFGDVKLFSKTEESVEPSALSEKQIVGLYFSAHWCPPCRGFTPVLASAYQSIVAAGKSFEVVFISWDRSESQFNEYYAEMPWMCLPFSAREDKQRISDEYGVTGIPCLVLLDGTGKLISKEGRDVITKDPKGDQFPWENASASAGDSGPPPVSAGDSSSPQISGQGNCCGLIFSITYILVAGFKGSDGKFCDGYWKTDVNAQLFGQVPSTTQPIFQWLGPDSLFYQSKIQMWMLWTGILGLIPFVLQIVMGMMNVKNSTMSDGFKKISVVVLAINSILGLASFIWFIAGCVW